MNFGNKLKGDNLLTYITDTAPFCIASQQDTGKIISKMTWNDVRHILIHMIKSKINNWQTRPTIAEIFLEVTCIGECGEAIIGFSRCYIELKEVITFIHVNKSTQNRYFFTIINEDLLDLILEHEEYKLIIMYYWLLFPEL